MTLSDAPLNPWTIPNAIGFVRLALLPVFLVVALGDDDGETVAGALLFGAIGLKGGATIFNVYLIGQIVPALSGVVPYLPLPELQRRNTTEGAN